MLVVVQGLQVDRPGLQCVVESNLVVQDQVVAEPSELVMRQLLESNDEV